MSKAPRGPALWTATCGPCGYSPVAPGTVGSLVGLAIAVGLSQLPLSRFALWGLQTLVIVAVGLVGLMGLQGGDRTFPAQGPLPGRQLMKFSGNWSRSGALKIPGWQGFLLGIILFRLMDIFKPFPARRAERLKGAWGIMLDDAAAGAYSLAILAAIGILRS